MLLLDGLTELSAELIWGLLARGIGLVLLISFASLAVQIVALGGRRGITPVADSLAAIERDFPAPQRYVYFPTLLWLSRSDRTLQLLPRLGVVLACVIIAGGPYSAIAFGACFVLYLSLDRAVALIYPWDCVLLEATFWGMFLPATQLLPDLAAAGAPLPAVAWVYRLMVFRVMVGFGKQKFVGSTKQDSAYLKGFFINQPLPTPVGLYVQRLPLWVHKLALVVMFLIELPVQLGVFFPGPLGTFAGLATMALMVGIQLTGNFGYFNVVMIVLGLSLLDNQTARAFTTASWFAADGPWFTHAVVTLHLVWAVLAFPVDSFCANTWMLWSPFWRLRWRFLAWPITLIRWLHPFRLVHAYGVFPPQSPPPIKLSPVTEVSWDGETFHPLRHRYWPTLESSNPSFCAPHHERFDQAVIYEGGGVNEAAIYRNIVGKFDPYGHGGVLAPRRMLERLVAGTLPERPFYDRTLEAKNGPPTHARVRAYLLEPSSAEVRRATGHWYEKTLVGPHFATITRGKPDPRPDFPPPELWHFEDVIWLERSRVGRLRAQVRRGESPHALVHHFASDATHIDAFWDGFLPRVPDRHRSDWSGLRSFVQELRQAFDGRVLYRMERIANGYGVLLFFKLAPAFTSSGVTPAFGWGKPDLDVPSLYHLRLLTLDIVSRGRAAFDAVWAQPTLAQEHARALTMHSGHLLQVLFRYEDFVYQSQKLRLLDAFLRREGSAMERTRVAVDKARLQQIGERLWGGIAAASFLREQFAGPEDVLDVPEQWPTFRLTDSGEVVRVERATTSD